MLDSPTHIEEAPRPSVRDVVADLSSDFRDYIQAETDVLRARGALVGNIAAWVGGLAIGILVAAQAMAVGLVVGALIILTRHVGAGWATAIVTGSFLLLIIVMALVLKSRLTAFSTAWSGKHE